MPRKATSPVEFEQIARVRTLLRSFRLFPSPDLKVMTASQKTYAGQLVRDQMGNNARKGGQWTYYGAIVLLTEEGEVEIDYLDIVWVEPKKPDGLGNSTPGRTTPCGSQDGSGMLPH